MVEYSGQSDIVGKDLNEQIAIQSIPAQEYAGLEVLFKSNKIALGNKCIHVPFSFKTTRKKQELEEMRKRTAAFQGFSLPRGKQEMHTTNTFQTLTRGQKDLKLVSYQLFFCQPSPKIRGKLQKLSTRVQVIGFSSFLLLF